MMKSRLSKTTFFLIFLIFLAAFSSLFFTSQSRADLWQDHLKPTLEDGFDEHGLFIIGAAAVSIALAQPNDYSFRDRFGHHEIMSTQTSQIGNILGSGGPGIAVALTQIYFDRENGWAHAEALIDAALATDILKNVDQRARPASDDHLSMPSGHTSTTFASATSLTYAYGWTAAVPAYALATFTGASRISEDAHWFSDTVAGAFVGFFWGRATYFHHSSARKNLTDEKVDSEKISYDVLPVISTSMSGATAVIRF